MKNSNQMKYAFLFLSLAAFMIYSCKKADDPDNQPPPPVTGGCMVQKIIAYNLTPIYEYTYNADNPLRLEAYKIRSDATGDVTHSYKIHYNEFLPDVNQVDTVTHWYGDYENGFHFSDKTVYEYHYDINNYPTMDSAILYQYDNYELNHMLPKGTIYYDYDDDGLLEQEEYLAYNSINFKEDYAIKYLYDANEQMIEMDIYDYQSNLTYYEKHELTNFIQPNYLGIVNSELAKSNLYAPSKTIGYYFGTGTYTYNFLYQVNDQGYVIEQSQILQNGDTSFLKLFEYKCN